MQRRNTSQRFIVYEAIEKLGHVSVENLIKHIQQHYDNISLATIYRNISILQDENKIKKVKLHGEDVLETIKHSHYHFVCKECGNIYDISEDKIKNAVDELKKIPNCHIEECEITLYGICSKCKEKE